MASKAILVLGLAYGDESKGACVDYLVRRHQAGLVVRYNGGCQAAHNVVLENGQHHTFSQFGAGTFVRGCRTYLSEYMLINPLSMENEEKHLCELGIFNAYNRTWVHPSALIVTPFHRAVNRLLEWSRGARAHGSCGLGIGATRDFHFQYGSQALVVRDLKHPDVAGKIRRVQELCRERVSGIKSLQFTQEAFDEMTLLSDRELPDRLATDYRKWADKVQLRSFQDLADDTHCIIFEGAQGVMLDEIHGTSPHNSWTNTTFGNAYKLLDGLDTTPFITRIGCLRTYYTRHGAGPFPAEDETLNGLLPEPHNDASGFQGKFRVGRFDIEDARYALNACGGVDEITLSHVDYIPQLYDDWEPTDYIGYLEERLNTPVNIIAVGPTAKDRSELKYAHSIDSHRSNSDLQSRLPRRLERQAGVR
jgi:adenylosuccinate synthase